MKSITLVGLLVLHFTVGSSWAQQTPITKVYAWGRNTSGQCNVPADLTNAVAISAGGVHSLALRGDGTVTAWGTNNYGQCSVPAGLSNVVAISAGNNGSLAVKSDGTVVAWGSTPPLPSGLTNVAAVSLGSSHALALTRDGKVITWFYPNPPCEHGSMTVPLDLSNVVAITANSTLASAAIRSDGTVVGWGCPFGTELALGGLTNAVAMDFGGLYSLVLQSDGTVVIRGQGDWSLIPPSDLTNAVAIASGGDFCLALRTDGTLRAWGDNSRGQLNVPFSPSGFTKIDAGGQFGLALVVAMKPIIEKSPTSRTVVVGSTMDLQVRATGARPLMYQWYHGTEVVVNGTNAILRFESVQPGDAGIYKVKVSNSEGEVLSDPATLTVVPAIDLAMVPAINVVGGLSSVYRIEYLDQVGSTGSWVPLATVTVTNQPQYYVDMSAMGHSGRFYRLVEVSP